VRGKRFVGLSVIVGITFFTRYENRAVYGGRGTQQLAICQPIQHAHCIQTLMTLAHPNCCCTRASIHELARLRRLNADLEQSVGIRTAELEASNKNLQNEIAARRRLKAESEMTSEIIQGVASTTNLDELLHLIHRSIGKILYAENCFVALYNEKTELLDMQFFVDKFDDVPPPFKMGMGLTAYVYRKRAAMLVTPNVIQELSKNGEIELIGTAPAIWLGVPLRTPAGIIGVLVFQHYEDKAAYSSHDLELLTAVGDQIALAIERKRVEDALRISEAQHRLLFETNPQPAFVYDLETLAFLAVNQAAICHYGYSRDEFSTITVRDIRPYGDVPDLICKGSRVSAIKDSILAPSTHRKKDGSIIDVEITSHELVFADKRAEIVLVNDVTERKLADERLKIFNQKLQQSNRELEDFAYVASHDLQEPLRKVQAFSDRLKTKYSEKLEGDGLDYLERMRSAASRMQLLIQDLLSFSRISTKAQPFVAVNLETVTQEVLSDLEVKIEETGATIELKGLPTIDADPMQMRQLMQNLIGNALKFRQKETTPFISISAEPIKSNGNGLGPQCQISVADNGIGFDEKYTDKIFAVFQRLHGRAEYEGSGVGLSICRKIAERHNGSITAQSIPGDGATFVVILPLTQSKVENKQ
jgi:PAS domain S-box-containing protein